MAAEKPAPCVEPDPPHGWGSWERQFAGGAMDGFVRVQQRLFNYCKASPDDPACVRARPGPQGQSESAIQRDSTVRTSARVMASRPCACEGGQ